MKKKALIALTSLPLFFLAACGEDKEPIKPDKEPVEIAKEEMQKPQKKAGMTVSEVSNLFTDNRYLVDYQDELKKAGYKKPTKDILLSKSPEVEKRGLIYKVKDGYAVLEYDKDTKEVVAVTSYENLEQIELQEMKTNAYLKEAEMIQTKDEAKKKALSDEINKMWTEITKRENGGVSEDSDVTEGSEGYEGNTNSDNSNLTIVN